MFRSRDHHQGAALFLAKVTLLKTLTDWFPYINLVLWQHVVSCRSCVAKRHTLSDTRPTQCMCISRCTNQMTLQNARCNGKDSAFPSIWSWYTRNPDTSAVQENSP